MGLFDLDEINQSESIPEDRSGVLSERFYDMHCFRVDSLKQLINKIPGENEILFLWSLKSFNAFTFIPYIINACGIIEELHIKTYTINRRIIDALLKQIDKGNIKTLHLEISDSLMYRLPLVYEHLQALTSERKNITVSYSWNHSKIACIKTAQHYLVIEGSGNFSENAQHEQYIFLNNERIYEFRKQTGRR
ncbi:MAG: hypothetical protein NTZ33_14420 [Bacteroidetes bacterium]|nr:hypothetical protein [Bacteroidota bacterium]